MKRLASFFRDPDARASLFEVAFPIGLALACGWCVGFAMGAAP